MLPLISTSVLFNMTNFSFTRLALERVHESFFFFFGLNKHIKSKHVLKVKSM